ncbi:hypothetical protein CPB83DRAFT_910037 [Crepidotus variabilis]|uniref:Uncharacterized protein n=1 Tax=Crepidotus variabilis TaxID=179855 RepID=A0A9P6E874_9AGAR|nr:hypothetical protein CPB83DRAFT_910037 [Crepidotus variabilis]
MSQPLPPELAELIINFVPLSENGDPRRPNKTLLTCTEVSQSFNVASRHRLFSTVFIAPTSRLRGTQAKLQALLELFEEHPDFLHFTDTVAIHLDCGIAFKWASTNDTILGRILTIFKMHQRKLVHLRIYCRNAPVFDQAFGQHTQRAILDLIPAVHSLTLSDMVVPATVIEKIPPLRYFNIHSVRLASGRSMSQAPLIFSNISEVLIDDISLKEIQQFYRRSGLPPPAYVNVVINTPSSLPDYHIQLSDGLSGSTQSLQMFTLKMVHSRTPPSAEHIILDFGMFKKLTTLKVKWAIQMDKEHRSWGFLEKISSYLSLFGTILGYSSSLSSLVKAEIEIICYGNPDDYEEVISSTKPVGGLDPIDLLGRYPKLKLITIAIISSLFNDKQKNEHQAKRSSLATENIGRCLKELVPSAVRIPNYGSVGAIVYCISLNGW